MAEIKSFKSRQALLRAIEFRIHFLESQELQYRETVTLSVSDKEHIVHEIREEIQALRDYGAK